MWGDWGGCQEAQWLLMFHTSKWEGQDGSDPSYVFWKLMCQMQPGLTQDSRVVTFPHVLWKSQSIAQGSIVCRSDSGRGPPEMTSLLWQWANRTWNPCNQAPNLLKSQGQVTLLQTFERAVCSLVVSSIVKALARRQVMMGTLSHNVTCPYLVSLSSHTGSPFNHVTYRDFPRRCQRQHRSVEGGIAHISVIPRSIKTLHCVYVCVCVCVCVCK
jgi:hypothetical protein